MDDGIKRKLVGAGVLVTVAIIVFPLITPQTQDAAYLSRSVPIEANIPDMSMPLPKSLSIATRDLNTDIQTPKTISMSKMNVDGNQLNPGNISVPIVDVSGQARVWHIQVASFAEPKNATKLRDKLRKSGYKAFDRPAADGEHIRVFVGPSTQRASLEQKLSAINKTFKIKGQIVPYLGK
jgi:cell division septation protein DedD